MPNNNLEEKIEGIIEHLGQVWSDEDRGLILWLHTKNYLEKSLRQFASDITEEILVEIENRKEYHKRMGTTDSFHNGGVSACVAILEAIKSKRDTLLGKY